MRDQAMAPRERLSAEERCPLSKRVDGQHGFLFDGDDPYVVCQWCHERRDARTGYVFKDERDPRPEMVLVGKRELSGLRAQAAHDARTLEAVEQLTRPCPDPCSHDACYEFRMLRQAVPELDAIQRAPSEETPDA